MTNCKRINNHLDEIKKILLEFLKKRIISATVYGSALNEDFCNKSDYDILLVVDKTDIKLLRILKLIKLKYKKRNIDIDFNIHNVDDIPSVRKKLFWHNNRGFYMQKEIELYGKQLIGPNLFKTKNISRKDIFIEAVKVINSLNYQARKLLINKELDQSNRILMMKWCIYGSLYALASRGIYPKTKRLAMEVFYDVFSPPINPEKFLHIKVARTTNITDEDVEVAYEFLTYLDKKIFDDYQLSGISYE